MANPIFYFKNLTASNKWTIGIYLIVTFILFYVIELDDEFIFYYCIISQIGLYLSYYKALRNLKFYFICIGIGILHLGLFYLLLEDSRATLPIIHSASNLRNTIPLLVVFQVLRLLNFLIHERELVSPQPSSFKDMHDKRYVMPSDYLFFSVYVFFLVALTIGWKYP